MIPSIPLLRDYDISPEYGFLPVELPLEVLPDRYYARWETVVANMQALLLSKRLRGLVDRMPVLSTSRLQHPAEWRRAYVLLAFTLHAYIWGGDKPEEVRLCPNGLRSSANRSLENPTACFHPVPPDMYLPRITASSDILSRVSLELQTDFPG